jgi:hypothetical protein
MKTLNELKNFLNSTDLEAVDTSSLPTFGGEEIVNTLEVFSWDAENVLTTDCNGNFVLQTREEFFA